MKLGLKKMSREFKLRIELPAPLPLETWVGEVIDGIENDTLLVFPPDDEDAIGERLEADGSASVNTGATLPVSIKEWLCVGCQLIRWEGAMDDSRRRSDKCLAFYIHNGHEVMWPQYAQFTPLGPGAFVANIVLGKALLDLIWKKREKSEGGLKFVIAHELVHVFDCMRLVVPAFSDWELFWNQALRGGCFCDVAASELHSKSLFIDDYRGENELAMVQEYWPSRAEEWFKELQVLLA